MGLRDEDADLEHMPRILKEISQKERAPHKG